MKWWRLDFEVRAQFDGTFFCPLTFSSILDFFKKYILLIMLLQLSHFPAFIPLCPAHSLPPTFLPKFMSMGHTHKIFGFYISYIILTLPLSIFYLPFMLLILCTFPLSRSPTDNPPCDHFCDSVPVLVFLVHFCFLVLFCFKVQLLIAVSSLSFYC